MSSYALSVFLSKIFVFKCTLPILRLTPMLCLLALPIILTRLLCYQRREHPPTELLAVTGDAIALSLFPIAWFFGFLFYTDVPSLAFVLGTVLAALQGRHILAAVVGIVSNLCSFQFHLLNSSRIARPSKLHIQTDKHCMGLLRICL